RTCAASCSPGCATPAVGSAPSPLADGTSRRCDRGRIPLRPARGALRPYRGVTTFPTKDFPMKCWTAPVAAAACAIGLVATAGTAGAATDDPLRKDLWGLDQTHAEQAWSTSTGEGAVVAVVDTGVDLGHPDLQGRLVPGADFVCGEQAGSCGDGGWQGKDGRGQESDSH